MNVKVDTFTRKIVTEKLQKNYAVKMQLLFLDRLQMLIQGKLQHL
jgi:hypothetical protein